MAKKHRPTEAELINDPSLRWTKYQYGEALECDHFTEQVRFWKYTAEGRIKLKTLVLAEMGDDYDPLLIRRPKFKMEPMNQEDKAAVAAQATAHYGRRRKRK